MVSLEESVTIKDVDPEGCTDLQVEVDWDKDSDQNIRVKLGNNDGVWMTEKRVSALQRLLGLAKRVHKLGL